MSGKQDDELSQPVLVSPNEPLWTQRIHAQGVGAKRRFDALIVAARIFLRSQLANESRHLFALTLAVGAACGLAAVAFHLTIQAIESLLIERAIHANGSAWMAWTVATPALGGLVAGAALTYLVPGARGSGIPQVKQAFAVEGGRIRVRDAVGKFFVGALQIGSGASLGREGPTVQICAGVASLFARATSLPPRNMRRLTPVGVAAGIAAAFNAPIAAVTFTIEEVVGTLDHAVLSGVVVAAALAAVIERAILGVHPVIEVQENYALDHASSLPLYGLLGLAAAVVSVLFTDGLLKLRLWFRGLRGLPVWTHPGVGGLMTGLLTMLTLRFLGTGGINGSGYATLGRALEGQLSVQVLVVLCMAKLVATVFSYSSGGAGGIFAPALFMGAMVGGAVGHLDVFALDHESRQLGAFALVGMGAVFAGVIRAPITSVLIIFEMTGGYGLVLPLMLANVTSYVIARGLRPTPIYEALLEQDGIVLPHAVAPAAHALEQLLVSDAMTSTVIASEPTESIDNAKRLVAGHSFTSLPVIDAAGKVHGIVPVKHLLDAPDENEKQIAPLMRAAHSIRSDATLLGAVVRMNDLGVRQLLVVDPESESRIVGVLAMSDLARAHAKAATTNNRSRPSNRPITHAELRAGSLMFAAAVVPSTANVTDLAGALQDGDTRALIVRDSERAFRVILPEYLSEFRRDEELQKMLIAADVARAAPVVDSNADLVSLIQAMRDETTDAAIVLDPVTSEPIGVLTKSTLALAFLEWYARQRTSQVSSIQPSRGAVSPNP